MRILLVDNLLSGVGEIGMNEFLSELGRGRAEVTMRFVTDDCTPADLVHDASAFDRVVAVGGDGTVSSIAYALRGSGIPLVPYPAGTANLLAQNVRMPLDPVELAEITLRSRPVKVDLGEICLPPEHPGADHRPVGFIMMAGAGFDATVMEGAQQLKPIIGPGAYFVSALQNLAPTVSCFTLDLDGTTMEIEGIAVLLANFGRIQFDLSVTHDSDATDGLFEVVVLKTKSVAGLIPAVWEAMLDRVVHHPGRSRSLEIHTARRIAVSAVPPLPLQADGDVLGVTTPFTAQVLPGACTLVVPRSGRIDKEPLPG